MKAVIYQENHFDPFGLNLKAIEETDLHTQYFTPEFRFQYNGKEKTETHRLMWNNHGARNLDLQLGRWWSLDPLSEKDARFSPFCFAFNNPIKHNDPDGKWPIETIWDAANVLYDVGAIIYHAATGDLESAKSAAVDLMADGGAMLIPYVPAGASKSKYVLNAFGAGGKKSKEVVEEVVEKTVSSKTRKEAIKEAKEIAKTPRKSKGGEDIPIEDLKESSRGQNWEKMKANGAKKLGAKNPKGKNEWMEHPDGHPDAGEHGIPEHHNGGHVHAVDSKGNKTVIPYDTKTKKK